jgi:hypothetical protein
MVQRCHLGFIACITFLSPLEGYLPQQWLQEWPHLVVSCYSTSHNKSTMVSIVALIVISKFLHYTILVTISGKRFFQQNFNLKMTRIQHGVGSWMLLDALFHCWEGSAGRRLKNVMWALLNKSIGLLPLLSSASPFSLLPSTLLVAALQIPDTTCGCELSIKIPCVQFLVSYLRQDRLKYIFKMH